MQLRKSISCPENVSIYADKYNSYSVITIFVIFRDLVHQASNNIQGPCPKKSLRVLMAQEGSWND